MKVSIGRLTVGALGLVLVAGVAGCTVKPNKASQARIDAAFSKAENSALAASKAAGEAEASAQAAADAARRAAASAEKAEAILMKATYK